MLETMKQMVDEAVADLNSKTKNPFGWSRRDTEKGVIVCRVEILNNGSKSNQFKRIWWLNKKRVAAAKIETL